MKTKQPKIILMPKTHGDTIISKVLEALFEYQFGDATEQEARQRFMKIMEIEHKTNPYGLIKFSWDNYEKDTSY